MPDIRNFQQARVALAAFVPPRGTKGIYTLERMTKLMTALENPQNSYKTIHIAGTSGKTSTAYYEAALLKAVGKKVGLTVSPHVDEVNERVQINLVPMPEAEFCKQLGGFIDIIEKFGIKPSYFELLVAFAFWEFARQNVDYAIIEVGMGGLLDATNVITRPDKICVITDVGLDHTNVLGNTLSAITTQKAGIIQKNNRVFTYRQNAEIIDVITQYCETKRSRLTLIESTTINSANYNLPAFQRRNWNLAYQVYMGIAPKEKLFKLSTKQLTQTTKINIPARMEVIKYGNKTIILDGAHNDQKLHALVASIREQYSGKKAAVLLSFTSGKSLRFESALRELLPITSRIIITSFEGQQDLPKRSIDTAIIAKACDQLGFNHINTVINPRQAFRTLNESPEQLLLITGSFYLLNHVRPFIFKGKHD